VLGPLELLSDDLILFLFISSLLDLLLMLLDDGVDDEFIDKITALFDC
jgi:hypothetical protein